MRYQRNKLRVSKAIAYWSGRGKLSIAAQHATLNIRAAVSEQRSLAATAAIIRNQI
jgi:hypothetical protein